MNYGDLLRDPRWQRKRLEAMAAADWKCQRCGRGDLELHVHHPKYKHGALPWEYVISELLVLCDLHHQEEHGLRRSDQVLLDLFSSMVYAHAIGDWNHLMNLAAISDGYIERGAFWKPMW